MAATVIGGTIVVGGQSALTGYIVTTQTPGGADIDMEDVDDAAGARASRLIFKVDGKIQLSLIATTGTFAEFPEGAMCTMTGLTDYFVDSCVITKTRSAQRAEVSMTDIGIT